MKNSKKKSDLTDQEKRNILEQKQAKINKELNNLIIKKNKMDTRNKLLMGVFFIGMMKNKTFTMLDDERTKNIVLKIFKENDALIVLNYIKQINEEIKKITEEQAKITKNKDNKNKTEEKPNPPTPPVEKSNTTTTTPYDEIKKRAMG